MIINNYLSQFLKHNPLNEASRQIVLEYYKHSKIGLKKSYSDFMAKYKTNTFQDLLFLRAMMEYGFISPRMYRIKMKEDFSELIATLNSKLKDNPIALLEDDEEDLLLPPRKNEPVYPAIPEGVTKKKLLRNEVKFGGLETLLQETVVRRDATKKKVYYRVNRKELMARLKKEAMSKMNHEKKSDVTKWWRAVYEWLKEKGIIQLNSTSDKSREKKSREKYRQFARYVVCQCLPDEDEKKVADRLQKIKEVEEWHGFFDELEGLLGGIITVEE